VIAAGLALTLALSATPSWNALDPAGRDARVEKLSREPLARRLVDVSAGFLGTPYVLSPLGEGAGFDPDPTLRYDAVDCLTFVEETIALSLARDEAQVPALLEQLRYRDAPTYADRNHLMEAEWLPFNEAKGFIRDVTRRYGQKDAVRTQKVISPAAWKTPSAIALELPADRQVTGRFPLWMIPLDKLEAHAAAIPSGTILLVVREDRAWKVTRLTHLGFVVRRGGVTYLRHANKQPSYRVVDEPLAHFIARNTRYDKWKVDGVTLFDVLPRPEPLVQSALNAP
jgi:hypothetical protein